MLFVCVVRVHCSFMVRFLLNLFFIFLWIIFGKMVFCSRLYMRKRYVCVYMCREHCGYNNNGVTFFENYPRHIVLIYRILCNRFMFQTKIVSVLVYWCFCVFPSNNNFQQKCIFDAFAHIFVAVFFAFRTSHNKIDA